MGSTSHRQYTVLALSNKAILIFYYKQNSTGELQGIDHTTKLLCVVAQRIAPHRRHSRHSVLLRL